MLRGKDLGVIRQGIELSAHSQPWLNSFRKLRQWAGYVQGGKDSILHRPASHHQEALASNKKQPLGQPVRRTRLVSENHRYTNSRDLYKAEERRENGALDSCMGDRSAAKTLQVNGVQQYNLRCQKLISSNLFQEHPSQHPCSSVTAEARGGCSFRTTRLSNLQESPECR